MSFKIIIFDQRDMSFTLQYTGSPNIITTYQFNDKGRTEIELIKTIIIFESALTLCLKLKLDNCNKSVNQRYIIFVYRLHY